MGRHGRAFTIESVLASAASTPDRNRRSSTPYGLGLLFYATLVPVLIVSQNGRPVFGIADLLFIPAGIATLRLLPSLSPPARWIGAFCLWALLNSLIRYISGSGDAITALLALRLTAILLPFIIVTSAPLSGHTMRRLPIAALLGGTVSSCVAIVFWQLGIDVSNSEQYLVDGLGGASLRAVGLFGNTASIGHFVATYVLIAILIAPRLRLRHAEAWKAVGIIAGAVVIFASSSRASILHVLIAIIVVRKWSPSRVAKMILASGCLLGALAIAVSFLEGPSFLRTAVLRFDIFNVSGESQFLRSGRTGLWLDSVRTPFNPIWGNGYKTASDASYGTLVDNQLVSALVELGFVGFGLLLGFWCSLLSAARHTNPAMSDSWARLLFALTLSEFVHSLTIESLTIWSSSPWVMLMIGWSYAMTRNPDLVSLDIEGQLTHENRQSVHNRSAEKRYLSASEVSVRT